MKKEKTILAVSLATLFAMPNFAQETTDTAKTKQLNEIVVSATRGEKNMNDVGRSVSIITAEDIRKSGANTLSEILSQQAGVFILGNQQNPGSLGTIYMRGANNNHTVILVDGVRITDPTSVDNSIDLAEMSLAGIEKIEIVRGSHSTLYGSSAIGGVVNIITNKKNARPGIHATAGVNGGVFNPGGSIFNESATLNYTHKSGLYVNAEVYNTGSKGFNSTVDTLTFPAVVLPGPYKHSDMSDGFKKTDIAGKAGYQIDKIDIYAGYKKIKHALDVDDGAFRDDDNYTVDIDRTLITYGTSYKINNSFSIAFNGGMSDMIRKSVDDSSLTSASGTTDHGYYTNTNKGRSGNHELQINIKSKGLELVAGGGMYIETMTEQTHIVNTAWFYDWKSNLDSLDIGASTSGGFIHADINGVLFSEKLNAVSLGLGARIIQHGQFGSALTYELNPTIKLNENALLYLSYSTGFSAPSLYKLYSPNKDFGSVVTRGNNTLRPEESNSLEIGIKQKVNDKLWWSACYFKTVVNNAIDYVYLWDGTKKIDSLSFMDFKGDTYINLGKQSNTGLEFSIGSKLSEQLSVSGNISVLNGKLDYTPENIDNSQTLGHHVQVYSNGAFISREVETIGLTRRPNTATLGLTYTPVKKLEMNFQSRFTGARSDIFYDGSLGPYGGLGTVPVGGYTLFNFSVHYEIIKGLLVSMRIENIADTEYYEIRGYATRGRGIYGGLRYSF